MITSTLLLTVFLGALVSGWHCALMCGGIAAASEKVTTIQKSNVYTLVRASRWGLVYQQLVMHFGRITTYMMLGAFAGLLGFPVWQQDWLPIQRTLFALASVIFLYQGYRILRKNKAKTGAFDSWLSSKTAFLWQRVSELALQKNSSSGYLPRFLSGLAWGLIPCGLIYSVLPLAFLSGDPLSGLLLMLAFGLGTLPNLLLISGLSARLAGWGHQRWASYLAASLMISTGLIGLYRAFTLPEALLKGGFCFSSTLIYNTALIG
jgi:sulfite exporter TauE/SafE